MIWIGFAVIGVLVSSLVVGLIVAAVLGEIGARVSALDSEAWSSMPLAASSGCD